ncbi:MAG: class C sortase [Eubacteriales bacterium]|nr:class C sortase [Eubacteriales bacterium]
MILCRLLIAVGIFGILYPGTRNGIRELRSTTEISAVNETVEEMDARSLEKIKEDAEQYNRRIYLEQKEKAFSYRGTESMDPYYESILNFGDGDNLLAWIRIPDAEIFLPVAHGTDAEKLQYEAGHMYGTSVPIGGTNTHAVIAAHTGLLTADLFTNLTRVEKGDFFYIYVAGEVHRYKTEEIRVVLPEEEAPWLQIEEGKDLVTLYTCTPYGINDHRLLVQGVRAEDGRTDADRQIEENLIVNKTSEIPAEMRPEKEIDAKQMLQKEYIQAGLRTAAGIAVPVWILLDPLYRKRKRKSKETGIRKGERAEYK